MPTTTSQPIALPSSAHNSPDYSMTSGSYTGSNGSFNPASYTRHFLGSPLSWRAGSFGGRFHSAPSGSPTAQLLSSIDPNDFKYGKMSSSIDSDRGSLLNALNVFDREGELCRNYTCCGLHLTDLHALLEHFEEVHIVVVDPSAPAQISIPFNPQCTVAEPQHPHPQSTTASTHTPTSHPQHHPNNHTPSYFPDVSQLQHLHQNLQSAPQLPVNPSYPHEQGGPFDPDDMELELELDSHPHHHQPTYHPSTARSSPSSGAPSPPDTPISTPLSSYPSPTSSFLPTLPMHHHHLPLSPYTSAPPSPHPHGSHHPISAFETTTLIRPTTNSSSNSNLPISAFPPTRPSVLITPEPFNAYARYSDYSSCMPGTVPSPPASTCDDSANAHNGVKGEPGCVPPMLLFADSNAALSTTPASTPSTSRVPSPTAANQFQHPHQQLLAQQHSTSHPNSPISPTHPSSPNPSSGGTSNTARASTTLSRPASSLLLSKPFRCPKPNCNKSYKQANGLKYHMTHGSCNFAPPKDLEHVHALLERKRRDRNAANGGGSGGSSGDEASNGYLSRNGSIDGGVGGANRAVNMNGGAYGDLGTITETELREVEREAERRLRPFACGVGDCQRRYKNMNGLRYHYQHSGDHGAVGLALLASGQHECLGHNANGGSGANGSNGAGGAKRRERGAEREGRRGSAVSVSTTASSVSSRAGSRNSSMSRQGTPVSNMSLPMQAQAFQSQQQYSPPSSSLLPPQSSPLHQQTFAPQQIQVQEFSPQHQHQQEFASQQQQQQQAQQQQLAYHQQFAQHQRQQYQQQLEQQQQQQFAGVAANGMYVGTGIGMGIGGFGDVNMSG